MTESTLENCPFCHSKNLEVVDYGPEQFSVDCMTCFTSGPTAGTEAEAVSLWNMRDKLTSPR